jgi:SNF2 family DNA or RNA helicase
MAQALSARLRPFLLRRTKEDVARELPPKTETVVKIELEGSQRELYETVRAALDEKVRAAVALRGLARSHIVVLDALLRLRQVCCDPRLLKNKGKTARVAPSAKRLALREMLIEMTQEGRRVLVFSAFAEMLGLIEQDLIEANIAYSKLIGATQARAEEIDAFQNGDRPVFLISLKAGGVGLNLTAADTVIIYDPWWNPAAEQQAIDRAHRIGQGKPVFVYKLIAAGTLEEKILELQHRKAQLATDVLAGAAADLSLSENDFAQLMAPLEEAQ